MANDTVERVIPVAKPPPLASLSQDVPFGSWSSETAGEKGFKVLLYGASGSGKTYMAGTFPRPIFLDIEGGMRTLLPLGRPILRYPKDPKEDVTELSQVKSFYNLIRKIPLGEAPFETIVIDSLNELQVLILKNLLSKYQATRQYDDQPTMADYGKLARDMQTTIRLFLQLPYHIVLTAISNEREYAEDQVSPQFIGKKTGPDIQRMMDVIGHCHVLQKKGEPVEHVVGFESTPAYVAKDRTGKLGKVVSNTYQAMLNQISTNKQGAAK